CLVRLLMSKGLNEAIKTSEREGPAEALVRLQKISLHNGPNFGRLVAYLLKERLELTFFECCYQGGIIWLDPQLIDWHRHIHLTVQIDHFAILQYLLASVGQFLARTHAFHLVDIVQ